MKTLFALMTVFLIGCNGEIETPRQEVTSKINDVIVVRSNNDDFTPVFDEVKKRQIQVKISPEILEDKEITQDIIERSAAYEPVGEINLDNGFRYVGQYYEDECWTKMYKKEYEVTWLYIHVDCNGNRSKYHKDK